MKAKRVMENLEGYFWTRFTEMIQELEELEYSVIWQSYEKVIVVDAMDKEDTEYSLLIGHANNTMWVEQVVAN